MNNMPIRRVMEKGTDLSERIAHLLLIEELFESYFHYNPVASWHKVYDSTRQAFYMDSVNDAYAAHTGLQPDAYEGQQDDRLWEKDAAEEFYRNDMEVVRHRSVLPIAERGTNPLTGVEEVFLGWKWPHVKDGVVVGVWGLCNFFTAVEWDAIKHDHPFYKRYKNILERHNQEREDAKG